MQISLTVGNLANYSLLKLITKYQTILNHCVQITSKRGPSKQPALNKFWCRSSACKRVEPETREAWRQHTTKEKITDGYRHAGIFCSFRVFQNQVMERPLFSDLLQPCLKFLCHDVQNCSTYFFCLKWPLLSKVVRHGSVLLAIRHYVRLHIFFFNICLYINYSDEWPEATSGKECVCIIRESTLRGCWVSDSEIINSTLIRAIGCTQLKTSLKIGII